MQVFPTDFNTNHAEAQSGEIFLTNIYTGDMPNIDNIVFHDFGF